MKRKQKEELRSKSIPELEALIEKTTQEVSHLSIDIQTGKIKNTTLTVRKKDELAVLKTILNEKKLLEKAQLKESK